MAATITRAEKEIHTTRQIGFITMMERTSTSLLKFSLNGLNTTHAQHRTNIKDAPIAYIRNRNDPRRLYRDARWDNASFRGYFFAAGYAIKGDKE